MSERRSVTICLVRNFHGIRRADYLTCFDKRLEKISSVPSHDDILMTKELRLTAPCSAYLARFEILIMADEKSIQVLPKERSSRYEHTVISNHIILKEKVEDKKSVKDVKLVMRFTPTTYVKPFISSKKETVDLDSDDDYEPVSREELDALFAARNKDRVQNEGKSTRGRGSPRGRGSRGRPSTSSYVSAAKIKKEEDPGFEEALSRQSQSFDYNSEDEESNKTTVSDCNARNDFLKDVQNMDLNSTPNKALAMAYSSGEDDDVQNGHEDSRHDTIEGEDVSDTPVFGMGKTLKSLDDVEEYLNDIQGNLASKPLKLHGSEDFFVCPCDFECYKDIVCLVGTEKNQSGHEVMMVNNGSPGFVNSLYVVNTLRGPRGILSSGV